MIKVFAYVNPNAAVGTISKPSRKNTTRQNSDVRATPPRYGITSDTGEIVHIAYCGASTCRSMPNGMLHHPVAVSQREPTDRCVSHHSKPYPLHSRIYCS